MSHRPAPAPRPLSKQRTWSPETLLDSLPPPRPLLRSQRSWSPDTDREEAWNRRSRHVRRHRRDCPAVARSNSVTDDDLDELKGFIELGFGFDSPEMDPKLADTLPALELFYAVNKSLTRTSSASSLTDSEPGSNIIDTGQDPETVKTRLKQWAQVVACSVRQSSPSPTDFGLDRKLYR